ncbi:unnamed protein product [Brassica oleracea]|uniref:(rape) hypothetical protein n=1 Tax=Brassica napus TaxID=3708 RepID=A0A816QDV6_BRANA|nr:unnamed protein product [Brassica napus]
MMRKLDESVLRVERIHEFGDGFTGGVKFREGYGSHRVYRYDASWLQTASSAVSVFSDHSESMFRSKRMSSFHSQALRIGGLLGRRKEGESRIGLVLSAEYWLDLAMFGVVLQLKCV